MPLRLILELQQRPRLRRSARLRRYPSMKLMVEEWSASSPPCFCISLQMNRELIIHPSWCNVQLLHYARMYVHFHVILREYFQCSWMLQTMIRLTGPIFSLQLAILPSVTPTKSNRIRPRFMPQLLLVFLSMPRFIEANIPDEKSWWALFLTIWFSRTNVGKLESSNLFNNQPNLLWLFHSYFSWCAFFPDISWWKILEFVWNVCVSLEPVDLESWACFIDHHTSQRTYATTLCILECCSAFIPVIYLRLGDHC